MIPHATAANFRDAEWGFLVNVERDVARVYSDRVGIPTLGVGYALIQRIEVSKGHYVYFARGSSPQNANDFTYLNNELLQATGQTLSQAQINTLAEVLGYLNTGQPDLAKQLIPVWQLGESTR